LFPQLFPEYPVVHWQLQFESAINPAIIP